MAPDALEALKDYPWPGNVRELENIIERAMILSEGEVIRRDDIASCLKGAASAGERPKDESLAEVERCHILKVLAAEGANKTQAARRLGIDVKTLYNKLREYEAETWKASQQGKIRAGTGNIPRPARFVSSLSVVRACACGWS